VKLGLAGDTVLGHNVAERLAHRSPRRACAAMGTEVEEEDGRLIIEWPRPDDTLTPPGSSRPAAARTSP
jgi:hypothetical protein